MLYGPVNATANLRVHGSYLLLSVEKSDENKRAYPVVYKLNK